MSSLVVQTTHFLKNYALNLQYCGKYKIVFFKKATLNL